MLDLNAIDFELNTAMLVLNDVEVKGEVNLNNVLVAIQKIRSARTMIKKEGADEKQD